MSNLNFGKKLWIRVDASGNAIANSSVWRKKKPSAGKWKEIQNPNLCCNFVLPPVDVELFLLDNTFIAPSFAFGLFCDAVEVLHKDIAVVTIDTSEVNDALNANLPFLGEFEVTAVDTITLHLKAEIASQLCDGGILTFTLTQN